MLGREGKGCRPSWRALPATGIAHQWIPCGCRSTAGHLRGTASCEKKLSTTLTRQALREQGDILGISELPGNGGANGHLPELILAEHTHRRKWEAARHSKQRVKQQWRAIGCLYVIPKSWKTSSESSQHKTASFDLKGLDSLLLQ